MVLHIVPVHELLAHMNLNSRSTNAIWMATTGLDLLPNDLVLLSVGYHLKFSDALLHGLAHRPCARASSSHHYEFDMSVITFVLICCMILHIVPVHEP